MGKSKKAARCKVPGCKGAVFARGMCQKDYRRELREETNGRQEQYANRYDEPRTTLTTRVKQTTKAILEKAGGKSAYLMGSKLLDDWAEDYRRRHAAA